MIEIEVKCIGKTESMDANGYSADIVFQHTAGGEPVSPLENYAIGAAIGTPNSAAAKLQSDKDLKLAQNLKYTLSGTFTIKALTQEESSNYILGQIYTLQISSVKATKSSKKQSE